MASSTTAVPVRGMSAHGASTANHLLTVMGGADRWLREGSANLVELGRGETIARRSERVCDIFFPESAVFGVISRIPDGRVMQTLTIGCEGSTAAVSLIDERSISDIVVQLPGRAVRVSTEAFAAEVAASPAFASAVRRHARWLFEEAQNEIACVNYHNMKGRVANWLLTNGERFDYAPLPVSQQMIAGIFGVRRPTITEVLQELTRSGAVEHSRGVLRIVDEQALRAVCCGCYRSTSAFRDEYTRLHSEMLGETRRLEAAARLKVPPADIAAARDAYVAAVNALAEQVGRLGDVSTSRIREVGARELAAFERGLQAYVRLLSDSRESPEGALASIKSPLNSWHLLPAARDLIGGLALKRMIDEYYADPEH